MYANLRITPFPQSPMIEVAFKHADKNKAAAVVNTLIDTYLEYHPSIYESPDIATLLREAQRRASSRICARRSAASIATSAARASSPWTSRRTRPSAR